MTPSNFYPWNRTAKRRADKLAANLRGSRRRRGMDVARRFKIGDTTYHVMADGSIRNPEHPRHERKVLGLSARQHRRLTKLHRREARSPST